MPKPKIGLALGSGSARGWSHIGIIEALGEKGISPDIVCGCSIGAMVGAAYVADRMSPLKEWVLALKWREIAGSISVGISRGGLIDGDVFKNLMTKLNIDEPIESYMRPFASVATDFATGREIWLNDGPVHEAVRASMALPGVFSPANHDGGWLLDGGLVNPVPVSACRSLGADFVIAVNLNENLTDGRLKARGTDDGQKMHQGTQSPILDGLFQKMPTNIQQRLSKTKPDLQTPKPVAPGYFEVLESSINIMQEQITQVRLSAEPPDFILAPRVAHMGLFEFQRAQEAIVEGRTCVEQALPELRPLLTKCGVKLVPRAQRAVHTVVDSPQSELSKRTSPDLNMH
mgnify:CR=1 FL=1